MNDELSMQVANGKIIHPHPGFDTAEDAQTWRLIETMEAANDILEGLKALFGDTPTDAGQWDEIKQVEYDKWAPCATCGTFMPPHNSDPEAHHVNEGYSSDALVPPVFVHYCAEHCPVCNHLDEGD